MEIEVTLIGHFDRACYGMMFGVVLVFLWWECAIDTVHRQTRESCRFVTPLSANP